ncbi:nuclear transport factor 2 family protein [Engelhardtia mirabilis]|uniref:SnoaL-like domain protein n=1 Tax=Engelhardtia mirabilis TaxID=2528011 RepID=A0A518BR81_9BACT|nr:SnoaL-like domain protein [Planctomycetes bacterium Pla133]QDV03809.1 SnoaL-like domain protein [Planctomycetes bacterium Pla86]
MGDSDYDAQKGAARANRAFYAAFEELDIGAMTALWHDDDGVQCIHPGSEVLIGRRRVIGSWAAIFEHTDSIRFELSDLQIQVRGDTAWATMVERIRASSGGEDIRSDMAATNAFVRTDGGWKLVLHHASPVQRRFFPEGL